MKKILLTLFVLCLALCGCAKQNEAIDPAEEKIDGVAWNHSEYDTIDEMNKAAGTNITSAAIAGKENESFIVISNSIAQYKFTANGEDWCIRASKDVNNDISGLNYENISFEKDIEATYYNDDVYAHRFFHDDVQYVIILDVKDKDVAMSHFDDVWADLQTAITGVQAGYENELVEEDGNVVYRVVMHNNDGTSIKIEYIYVFEGDTMVSLINKLMFETENAAKAYYDELVAAGTPEDTMTLDGTIISTENTNVDFYSDYTKEEFFEMMKSSLAQ